MGRPSRHGQYYVVALAGTSIHVHAIHLHVGGGGADDACDTRARLAHPSRTSSDRPARALEHSGGYARRSSHHRKLSCFPSVPGQGRRPLVGHGVVHARTEGASAPASRPLLSDLSRTRLTRESTTTESQGSCCAAVHRDAYTLATRGEHIKSCPNGRAKRQK